MSLFDSCFPPPLAKPSAGGAAPKFPHPAPKFLHPGLSQLQESLSGACPRGGFERLHPTRSARAGARAPACPSGAAACSQPHVTNNGYYYY